MSKKILNRGAPKISRDSHATSEFDYRYRPITTAAVVVSMYTRAIVININTYMDKKSKIIFLNWAHNLYRSCSYRRNIGFLGCAVRTGNKLSKKFWKTLLALCAAGIYIQITWRGNATRKLTAWNILKKK